MRTLTVYLDRDPFMYKIPDGMFGEDWYKFKRDYSYFIQTNIRNALKHDSFAVTIDLDSLPKLSDDLKTLKAFMESKTVGINQMSVPAWNIAREEAKNFFTAPCIQKLDTSGFIRHCLK
jgi:hypothetical protein